MFVRAPQSADASIDRFRQEVRAFCAAELPPAVSRKVNLGQHLDKGDYDRWLQALGAKGWLTAKWPKAHGGQDWGPAERLVFDDETSKAGAPWLIPFGVTMVGPVIYSFGSDELKQRYLPGIAANTTWWCQGYSEPGAGSDLANLKTRAVRAKSEDGGDHYVVNGQKIWTTLAHWADMIFCLVRTKDDGKPQDGISFLLIDMKTPGITVKPIITIDLGHHLNEVFFDNVRVPAANRVGEENKGWTYAKFLLGNERIGVAEIGKYRRALAQLHQLAGKTKESGQPLSQQPSFARKLADLDLRMTTLEALVGDQLAALAAGAPALMGAAILKIRGSELQQSILETMVEALARHGLPFQTEAMIAGWNGDVIGPEESAGVLYEHLYRRAATIYGGTNEIQRNIIAKGALGL